MHNRNRSSRALCGAGLLAVAVVAAGAPPQRTFVSSCGNDVNACSLAAPCRAFAAAVAVVAPGGEVVALDSGGYGPVTISKAVTIAAPAGIYAGISVFSGDGVTVAAGASDAVTLRGLSIASQRVVTRGVNLQFAGRLAIEACANSGEFIDAVSIGDVGDADVLIRDTHVRGAINGVHSHQSYHGQAPRLTVIDSTFSAVTIDLFVDAGQVSIALVGPAGAL